MPTSTTVGAPGAANELIGGVPVIHYYNWISRGRGQVLRLMCEDAKIAYTDVRYAFPEWPEAKNTTIAKLNPSRTIPVVEVGDEVLTRSYAILRKWARALDKYDGKTDDEKYWVDAMCDVGADWRTLFVQAKGAGEESLQVWQKTKRHTVLEAVEGHLTTNKLTVNGPFVLGSTFTYADLVVYSICHDEGLTQDGRKGLQGYPRLMVLVDAVEARPNIKSYMQSDRYLG